MDPIPFLRMPTSHHTSLLVGAEMLTDHEKDMEAMLGVARDKRGHTRRTSVVMLSEEEIRRQTVMSVAMDGDLMEHHVAAMAREEQLRNEAALEALQQKLDEEAAERRRRWQSAADELEGQVRAAMAVKRVIKHWKALVAARRALRGPTGSTLTAGKVVGKGRAMTARSQRGVTAADSAMESAKGAIDQAEAWLKKQEHKAMHNPPTKTATRKSIMGAPATSAAVNIEPSEPASAALAPPKSVHSESDTAEQLLPLSTIFPVAINEARSQDAGSAERHGPISRSVSLVQMGLDGVNMEHSHGPARAPAASMASVKSRNTSTVHRDVQHPATVSPHTSNPQNKSHMGTSTSIPITAFAPKAVAVAVPVAAGMPPSQQEGNVHVMADKDMTTTSEDLPAAEGSMGALEGSLSSSGALDITILDMTYLDSQALSRSSSWRLGSTLLSDEFTALLPDAIKTLGGTGGADGTTTVMNCLLDMVGSSMSTFVPGVSDDLSNPHGLRLHAITAPDGAHISLPRAASDTSPVNPSEAFRNKAAQPTSMPTPPSQPCLVDTKPGPARGGSQLLKLQAGLSRASNPLTTPEQLSRLSNGSIISLEQDASPPASPNRPDPRINPANSPSTSRKGRMGSGRRRAYSSLEVSSSIHDADGYLEADKQVLLPLTCPSGISGSTSQPLPTPQSPLYNRKKSFVDLRSAAQSFESPLRSSLSSGTAIDGTRMGASPLRVGGRLSGMSTTPEPSPPSTLGPMEMALMAEEQPGVFASLAAAPGAAIRPKKGLTALPRGILKSLTSNLKAAPPGPANIGILYGKRSHTVMGLSTVPPDPLSAQIPTRTNLDPIPGLAMVSWDTGNRSVSGSSPDSAPPSPLARPRRLSVPASIAASPNGSLPPMSLSPASRLSGASTIAQNPVVLMKKETALAVTDKNNGKSTPQLQLEARLQTMEATYGGGKQLKLRPQPGMSLPRI